MTIRDLCILAALDVRRLRVILDRLPPDRQRGRPWSCTRPMRVAVTCAALRTNPTMRELAAITGLSKSSVQDPRRDDTAPREDPRRTTA